MARGVDLSFVRNHGVIASRVAYSRIVEHMVIVSAMFVNAIWVGQPLQVGGAI